MGIVCRNLVGSLGIVPRCGILFGHCARLLWRPGLLASLVLFSVLAHNSSSTAAGDAPNARAIQSILDASEKPVEFVFSGKYGRQREIVRRILNISEMEDVTGRKADIGIALEDLNGDGRAEILGFVEHAGWCGSRGCAFEVLAKNKDNIWRSILSVTTYQDISILETKNHGYYDFRFGTRCIELSPTCRGRSTWRFDGRRYRLALAEEEHTDAATKTKTTEIQISEPPYGGRTIYDIR